MLRLPREIEVHVNKFKPRHYQLPFMDAVLNKGYKRVMGVLPRRAGKDMMCWNIAIRFLLIAILRCDRRSFASRGFSRGR